LDASHIDLSLSLCEWAKVHDSKASMKLSIGLNHSSDIPEFVAVENGKENDIEPYRVCRRVNILSEKHCFARFDDKIKIYP